MKVFVLGHRGMLGHVVARYLSEQGIQILCSNHRYTGLPGDPLISSVRESNSQWVVNAIGKVDPKATSPTEMLLVNAQLPVHLVSFLRADQRVIHASSDGVFSGKHGNYCTGAERDAEDLYGFSKILGEVVAQEKKAYVIRTSIIGPPTRGNSGLLGWYLSQRGSVRGFKDHKWNGITALEWAKIALELVSGKLNPTTPIFQATCGESISKCELLKCISKVWNYPVSVIPTDSGNPINRTLIPDVKRPVIEDQLIELRDWCSKPGDQKENI
jgi:dTDP-4-dehydrorhamnose reductase